MLIYVAFAISGFLFLLAMLFVGEIFGADHEVGAHDVSVEHGGADHGGGPSISQDDTAVIVIAPTKTGRYRIRATIPNCGGSSVVTVSPARRSRHCMRASHRQAVKFRQEFLVWVVPSAQTRPVR